MSAIFLHSDSPPAEQFPVNGHLFRSLGSLQLVQKNGYALCKNRMDELGRQLRQGPQHEQPVVHPRMRHLHTRLVEHRVSIKQQIEIDRARTVPFGTDAIERRFDAARGELAHVFELGAEPG